MFKYEQKFHDLRVQVEALGLSVDVDETDGFFIVTISNPGRSRVVTRRVPERRVRLGYSTCWFAQPGKALYKALDSAWKEWQKTKGYADD